MPKKGDIAVCSAGSIGLITSAEPQEVTYNDGTKATAFVGIHLTDKIAPIGSPWSSRNPKVFAHVSHDGFFYSHVGFENAGLTLLELF